MSQTYTDDCYSLSMQATTSLQAFEDNFAALKSAFSGVTAPGNTVAGMWWYDTTAHILRVRNEDNTAWLSVWDLANNKTEYRDWETDRKSTRLNSSHITRSRMPSSA